MALTVPCIINAQAEQLENWLGDKGSWVSVTVLVLER